MAIPIVAHPAYAAPLPDGHRFPMPKYRLLAERLLDLGLAPASGFVHPEPASRELVAGAHDMTYVDQVFACDVPREIERRIGLPVDEGVARRARMSTAGTLLAARLALAHGLAGSAAGGSHHAQRATGAGFCIFNDVAIAARALLRERAIGRAVVIDLDVHQGDGTAECLGGDPDLFTFSMHAEKNYPVRKIPSDLDVGLPTGSTTGLHGGVAPPRTETARCSPARPRVLQCGRRSASRRQPRAPRPLRRRLRARDRYVVGQARARGIPLVAVVGGGYGPDPAAIARRHAFVFEAMAAAA
jgi:acetoin utilization deacetylase AcuC-like enzyme